MLEIKNLHVRGGGKEILTRTLSDGIISAVGRTMQNESFLQVTAPL